MSEIVVVGGGPIGLIAPLLLACRGHHVAVWEQVSDPIPPNLEAAWQNWRRPGVTQLRLPHTLVSLGRQILRNHLPEVFDGLLAAECTEIDRASARVRRLGRARFAACPNWRSCERHQICCARADLTLFSGEVHTQAVSVDGFKLEYDDQGQGETIIFIHGSILANSFAPVAADPSLAKNFRRITYHRRGFAGSTHPNHPISIAEQAEDCRKLLKRLNVRLAHVVGYSYGASIALQLAGDAPQVVSTLALLEPALLAVPSGADFVAAMGPVVQLQASGEKARAIDAFLRLVYGKGYRVWLDRVLPGAFAQAVPDADTFFCQEWPALQKWCFTAAEARAIPHASILVLGANSASIASMFVEGHELLCACLPHVESFELTKASHGLLLQNASDMAVGLSAFLARHRTSGASMAKSVGGEMPRMRR